MPPSLASGYANEPVSIYRGSLVQYVPPTTTLAVAAFYTSLSRCSFACIRTRRMQASRKPANCTRARSYDRLTESACRRMMVRPPRRRRRRRRRRQAGRKSRQSPRGHSLFRHKDGINCIDETAKGGGREREPPVPWYAYAWTAAAAADSTACWLAAAGLCSWSIVSMRLCNSCRLGTCENLRTSHENISMSFPVAHITTPRKLPHIVSHA